MAENIHQGRNIKRFREMLGLKQEGLAYELGEDWNQKKISLLESKEVVDEALLEQVAKVLKVPKAAIENLTEDGAVQIIANTFHNNSHDQSSFYSSAVNYQPTFNPFDKYAETVDELKRLNKENKQLYERIVQIEREKNDLLQQLLTDKNKQH